MALDLDAVGRTAPPWTRHWTSSDTLLYALAVGAGPAEPDLTTENSTGVTQRAVPTYAAILAGGSTALRPQLGDWEPGRLVHAGQWLRWHRELPAAGTATLTARVAAITDKGSGALVEIATSAVGHAGSEPLFEARTSLFIRGEGGFDPARESGHAEPGPAGPPDERLRFSIPASQALLYRLCGDRNPLHSDPVFARRAGFDRPILHGLCTFGVTTRLLMNAVADGDPARLRVVGGRFRSPVHPGDEIEVRVWRAGPGRVTFETHRAGGVAIDRGELVHDSGEGAA